MDVTELCEEYQAEVKSFLAFKFPEHSDEEIDKVAHCITHMFVNAVNYVLTSMNKKGD